MNKEGLGCLGFLIFGIFYLFYKFFVIVFGVTFVSVGSYYIFVSLRSMIAGYTVDNFVIHFIVSLVVVILGVILLRHAFKRNREKVSEV